MAGLSESGSDVILPNEWRGVRILEQARAAIKPVDTVLDVGAGIRPQSIVPCARQVCMEPHYEYAAILLHAGYKTVYAAAPRGFDYVRDAIDTVVLLDVIEHMTKDDGALTIRRSLEIARVQVVVFTPLGFLAQSGDAWGLRGDVWQQHRSGWTPDDFPGWRHFVNRRFAPKHGAFVAIHDA